MKTPKSKIYVFVLLCLGSSILYPARGLSAFYPMPDAWIQISLEYLLLDQSVTNFNNIPPEIPPSFAPMILSQVPSGYAARNSVYSGWCIEPDVELSETYYTAKLFDPYDPLLPTNLSSLPWNQINYLLNNKLLGWTNAIYVQQAIWSLIDGTPPYLVNLYSPKAAQLLQAALTYGVDFVPTTNQTHAIVVYPDRSVQKLILELVPVTITNTNAFKATIVITNNQLVIGWQGDAATFLLESTTNLVNPEWLEVPDSSGKPFVSMPMVDSRRFYRWRRP